MKFLTISLMVSSLATIQPALAAAPIADLGTNPVCADAFYQAVHALKQMTEAATKLKPGSPTPQSCRTARRVLELNDLHLRLNMRMFALCHQDGSDVLAREAAGNEHLHQVVPPRYCR